MFLDCEHYSRVALVQVFLSNNLHTLVIVLDGIDLLQAIKYRLERIVKIIPRRTFIHLDKEGKMAVYSPAAIDGALLPKPALIVPYLRRFDDVSRPTPAIADLVIVGLAHHLPKDGLGYQSVRYHAYLDLISCVETPQT